MAEPRKSFIVQLPKDIDFKKVRTEAYEKGVVLMPAHQQHAKNGLKAHKLKGTESQLKWFKATYCPE